MSPMKFGFRAIVPKQFDTTKLMPAMKKTLTDLAKKALKDFKLTTENWDEPVEFRIDGPHQQGKDWIISVGTDNVIWGWVDEGTQQHRISATWSRDGLLHFEPTEALVGTRTRPGSLSSGQIRRGDWVTKRSVVHPGIEARNFTSIIQANVERAASKMFTVTLEDFTKRILIAGRPAKPPESACFRPGHGC